MNKPDPELTASWCQAVKELYEHGDRLSARTARRVFESLRDDGAEIRTALCESVDKVDVRKVPVDSTYAATLGVVVQVLICYSELDPTDATCTEVAELVRRVRTRVDRNMRLQYVADIRLGVPPDADGMRRYEWGGVFRFIWPDIGPDEATLLLNDLLAARE